MGIEWNEISSKSNGGTELMGRRLESSLPKELLNKFQIFPSRVRNMADDKIKILWCHDLVGDPESDHLKNGGWKKFHKIVFVSYWQQQQFMAHYNIPWSKCAVIQNAIEPVLVTEKPKDKIKLIYHTTPHRGLQLLVPVFQKLAEKHNDIHLDVYSSFKIYGWDERDKPFKELFDQIDAHEQMTNHGTVENSEVRKALAESHIFVYPSIWPETSCLSLMEAMSAKCLCIHPTFGALPETSANWTFMYSYHEDMQTHAEHFYVMLESAINVLRSPDNPAAVRLEGQKSYTDLFYSMDMRKVQWLDLLRHLENADPAKPHPEDVLVFRS